MVEAKLPTFTDFGLHRIQVDRAKNLVSHPSDPKAETSPLLPHNESHEPASHRSSLQHTSVLVPHAEAYSLLPASRTSIDVREAVLASIICVNVHRNGKT